MQASEALVSSVCGNTPLSDPPADYCPPADGHWFTLSEGLDAGKKLFFRDSQPERPSSEAVVFVHGNPECSYIYRDVITHLSEQAAQPYRLLAMDHIGFGLSDTASYEMVAMDHAANLLQLIRHLDLKDVTLVVHDWGGPIGIGAFLEDAWRVKNLVITNTTVFPIPEQGFTYENYPISWLPWSRLPDIVFDGQWGDLAVYAIGSEPKSASAMLAGVAGHLLTSVLGMKKLSPAERVFKQQMADKNNVRTSKRFVRQTPFWGAGSVYEEPQLGSRDDRPFYKAIHEKISREWAGKIGARAVLGRWDPLGKEEVIAQWIENLPQLEGHVTVFEDVGHFIEEFKPAEIAAAIVDVANLA